jgi:hypothetical protein
LSIVETSTSTINQNNVANADVAKERVLPVTVYGEPDDLSFKLGLWLSGLQSFLNLRSNTLAEESRNAYDWSKEFRLTHSVLLLCSKLTLDFAQEIRSEEISETESEAYKLLDPTGSGSQISSEEVFELSFALKESVLLSEGLLRAAPLKFSEWIAWSNSLADRLKNIAVVQKLIKNAESEGERFLPQKLRDLLDKREIPSAWDADLRLVLPRFAKVLKWLSVVGKMLRNDEPLKTTLVLFARINEQMQEMMSFINNRLLRFPDENDALFGSLDAAAYTASIELRKVYNQELKGLAEIRPTPLIYAKIETAYALLNDCLQLTLINFAQLVDGQVDAVEIFPNLQTKEQQSLQLRENMWNLLQHVQSAENSIDKYPLDSLYENLNNFRSENLRYLFYKDLETVDRFIEEILITDKKDLVPLLHRFGAYLETLLGQVNNRVVLAGHPFEPMQKESHEMFV